MNETKIFALLRATEAILSHENFIDAARAIFDQCVALIGATSGYVALLSEDGHENEVLFLESGGLECSVDPSLPMPIRGLRAEAYKTGKVVYDNFFETSEWMKFMPDGHVTLKNVMFAPLKIDEVTVGLMGIANKPAGFTDDDAFFAGAFANYAALALRDSRRKEALIESERHYRTVVQAAMDGFCIADSSGKITGANDAYCDMSGYTEDELFRMTISGLEAMENLSDTNAHIERIIAEGHDRFETMHRRKDGTSYHVEVSVNFIPDNGGQFVCFIRDISERKKAENELDIYREKLEELVEARTKELLNAQNKLIDAERLATIGRFSGSIAHELKNPLAVVDSSCYILQNIERDPARMNEHIKKIRIETKHCLDIIDSIQRLKKLEEPKRTPFAIKDLVDRAISTAKIPETISLDTCAVSDVEIFADMEQLRIALKNLIANAVQAMPGNGALRIYTEADDEAIRISVRDTGSGIPADKLEKIFEPLYTTKPHGMGFGLSIVKMIVEKHGATISVESEEDKGTTFTIVLPVEQD